MSQLILPKAWQRPEKEITPENVFNNRRHFLKLMGFATAGIAGALVVPPAFAKGMEAKLTQWMIGDNQTTGLPPIANLKRNPDYTYRRAMTKENAALTYNNFYEFTAEKELVWRTIDAFKPRPWEIAIGGLVEKPGVYDVDDFLKSFNVEERVYRHRCVETWAMVVPWVGFPLSDLIQKVQPKNNAKYIKFTSFDDPAVAPGQKRYRDLPWPYTEGLTMAEAMNELAFISTGIYGHSLPNQHGAPIRLVTPWKYGFEANVNPDVPHPRWSQRREKMIGTGDVFATVKYNGYGDFVAELYE